MASHINLIKFSVAIPTTNYTDRQRQTDRQTDRHTNRQINLLLHKSRLSKPDEIFCSYSHYKPDRQTSADVSDENSQLTNSRVGKNSNVYSGKNKRIMMKN